MRTRTISVVLGLLLTLFAASDASAQPHAEIARALAPPKGGESLVIQTADGSEVVGDGATLASGVISMVTRDGERITLKADDVARISLKDSNKDGVLYGALAGAGAGALLGLTCRGSEACYAAPAGLAVYGALAGMAIGGLFDNADRVVVYRRTGRPVAVGPAVSSSVGAGGVSLGAGVRLRW